MRSNKKRGKGRGKGGGRGGGGGTKVHVQGVFLVTPLPV